MKKIYLDYAATTPVDPMVSKAMEPYFKEKFGNPGSIHSFGQEAIAAVDLAREKIAIALNAKFNEIIFVSGATEANNLALRGVVRNIGSSKMDNGRQTHRISQIIVSSVEHESILETARDLEKQGIEVAYLPVSGDGFIDLRRLKEVLNKRTVLVSVMYANNEIGTIQPIGEISRIIKDFNPNILFHADAVQAYQYLECDVSDLGVDLMTISSHKIYGPKGAAALYKRSVFSGGSLGKNILIPIITGGGQEFGMRSGTENVPAIVGLGKAVEIAEKLRKKESLRVEKLRDQLFYGLKKIYPKILLNGSMKNRLPNNLNISLLGKDAGDLIIKLDLAGISVSSGSACSARISKASHVLTAMGLDSVEIDSSIRFSLGRGTTEKEINTVLRILPIVLKD